MADTTQDTSVSTVDIDLNTFFPGTNFDKIKPTKNVFSPDQTVDLNRLSQKHTDTDDDEDEQADDPDALPKVDLPAVTLPAKKKNPVDNAVINAMDRDLEKPADTFEEASEGSTDDLRSFFKSKIEAGEIAPFSDFDETKTTLDEYLKGFKRADFDELYKMNEETKISDIKAAIPKEFFSLLPPEIQKAAKYAMEGGTDLQGLFLSLAAVEQLKTLDVKKDAEEINRQYLTNIDFGTPEEIEEQLEEWKDLEKLQSNAEKNHPKLIKAQEVKTQAKVEAQTKIDAQKQEAYNFYHDSVVEAIKDKDLNGLKIDEATQASIYEGLTQNTHKDRSGRPVTRLNYQLENIMFGEPNYKLLSKIQWLLDDEAGYETAVSKKTKEKLTEQTVRTLKTEQNRRTGIGQVIEEKEDTKYVPSRKVPRQSNKMFSR